MRTPRNWCAPARWSRTTGTRGASINLPRRKRTNSSARTGSPSTPSGTWGGRQRTRRHQAQVQVPLRRLREGAPVRGAHRGEPGRPVQAPEHPGGLCPSPRDDRGDPRRRDAGARALIAARSPTRSRDRDRDRETTSADSSGVRTQAAFDGSDVVELVQSPLFQRHRDRVRRWPGPRRVPAHPLFGAGEPSASRRGGAGCGVPVARDAGTPRTAARLRAAHVVTVQWVAEAG